MSISSERFQPFTRLSAISGICLVHGPWQDGEYCPKWPACKNIPWQSEFVELASRIVGQSGAPINVDDYHVREISEQIREKELEYLDDDRRLREFSNQRDAIEMHATSFIAEQKVDGKPRYTNDTARRAAVAEMLKASGPYREASAKVDEIQVDQRRRRVEIEHLERSFRIGLLAFEAISIGRRK